MPLERPGSKRNWTRAAITMLLLTAVGSPAMAGSFEDALSRVDNALRTNPNHVPPQALYSCQDRRQSAVVLNHMGSSARAERSLLYCFQLLGIPEREVANKRPEMSPEARAAASAKKAREDAAREFEAALALKPNIEHGLQIYRECARCHTPEGWGLSSGVVPQLAGQHRSVVIKQLADFRAGNRDNRVMIPYASAEEIGGAQAIADVAGYIDTLEISVENGKGPGEDLELGAKLYRENCIACHGATGEGDNARSMPRIQAQHYQYLVTQFEWIRDGKRRNANPEMIAQIKNFDARQVSAVLDYVSRLEPETALQAPPGWRNPDFTRPEVKVSKSVPH